MILKSSEHYYGASLNNPEHWETFSLPEDKGFGDKNGTSNGTTIFVNIQNDYFMENYGGVAFNIVARALVHGTFKGGYTSTTTNEFVTITEVNYDGLSENNNLTISFNYRFGNYYVEFSCFATLFEYDPDDTPYNDEDTFTILHHFNITITDIRSNVNIFDNINEGAVSVSVGSSYAGGIVGRTMQHVSVSNSKNSGKVENSATTGTNFAGGIIGGTYPGGVSNVGKVSNCLNTGAITAKGGKGWAHGIGNDLQTILKSRNDGAISGSSGATDGDTTDELDEDRLPSFQSSNNWSSHVDEAVSGGSMGKGDYYYDSTNSTYYVYTAAGLAYAVLKANSTSTIELMNNIDLSDYNWDLGEFNENNTVVVPGGSGGMYVSRDGNYYTGTVTIGGYTYTLVDGGRGCFISSEFGSSNGYFSVTAGGSVNTTLTFPHGITGSLKGTMGSDGTGTLTLTINGGSYTEERGYILEKNEYEIYGYKA